MQQQPSAAMQKQPKQPFRFLDLPPELRNRVYEYLLEYDGQLDIEPAFFGSRKEGWTKRRRGCTRLHLTPQVLATCKLIHQEATPILYANNRFDTGVSTIAANKFIEQINSSAAFLQNITVAVQRHRKVDFRAVVTKLKAAKHLKSLTLYDRQMRFDGPSVLVSDYTPEYLAKLVGPFVRALHKAQKKDTEHKTRDVVDMINLVDGHWLDKNAAEVAKLEADVKAILLKTLK